MSSTGKAPNPGSRLKRSLLFGLLGVLVVLPYAFNLIVGSWANRMFVRGVLLRRRDAELYGYIDTILPYVTPPVQTFIYVFCFALALGLAIRMLYAAWRVHPLRGVTRGRFLLEVSGRAAVVMAVAVLFSGPGLDSFFLYPPEGVMLIMSSYGGAAGPLVLYLFPMLQLAAYGFALGVLVYAAVSARGFGEFAMEGAAGLGIALVLIAGLYQGARHMDLDRYLDCVPGVSMEPEPRTLVVLTEKPSLFRLDDNYNDCSVSDTFCKKIPSSSKNAEAVGSYIIGRGYNTALRGAAFGLIALNRLRELDPAGAMAVYEDALTATGDVTQGISLQARLVGAPATPFYRRMLYELSDETRFSATGRAALRFGKAYARYGELEMARYWHDKGISTVTRLTDVDRVLYRLTDAPPFCGGSISGKVMADGVPASGVRVGLMKYGTALRIVKSCQETGRAVMPFIDLQGMTDGTATGDDGRFGFEGLEAGEYVLLLSLEDGPGRRYIARAGPGMLRVTPDGPAADAGAIRISSEGL